MVNITEKSLHGRRKGKEALLSTAEYSVLLNNAFPQEKLFYQSLTYSFINLFNQSLIYPWERKYPTSAPTSFSCGRVKYTTLVFSHPIPPKGAMRDEKH
jgi:hypothetical protein